MKKKQTKNTQAPSSSPLDPILEGYVSSRQEKQELTPVNRQGLLIGQCQNDRHPSISGRVLIVWEDGDSGTSEHWLPTIQGLAVRKLDQVLLQQPLNWPEPVVIGVLDSCSVRNNPDYKAGPTIDLKTDESVCIVSHSGSPLLEIFQKDNQPVVRLLTDDVDIDLNGKMKISAESIEFYAKKGLFSITAEGDVVVKGDVVELN
ncbi:MAG: hypothetical protein L3J24_07755 [Xanthomonadales bacterium]|nr:hypothetical protein [Xanthomonadales bacterium]